MGMKVNLMNISANDTIRDILEHKSMLRSLVIKNLIGRYKNSYFGLLWHFITPSIMMLVYYVVFTEIRTSTLDNFWLYLASGLFPFHFMLNNLSNGSSCIIDNAGIIKKMYIPKMILVLSQVISTFIVMLIGYLMVIVGMLLLCIHMTIYIALVPVIMGLMFIFVVGYVSFFSAVTVYARDLIYFINSINMVFFFMTPMYFLTSNVTGLLSIFVWVNPFTYYVEMFHYLVYWGAPPSMQVCIGCIILPILTILLGCTVFRKLSPRFAEKM